MHDQISANDKDFKPAFIKLCKLATVEIFKLAHQLGQGISDYYEEDEYELMVSNETMETMIEERFLETVYGAQSRVSGETWLENVSDGDKAEWILKAGDLREMIFKDCEIK